MSELKGTDDSIEVDYGYVEIGTGEGTISQENYGAFIDVNQICGSEELITVHLHNGRTSGMNLYMSENQGWAVVTRFLEQLITM